MKKFFLLLILLSSSVLANPMCPDIRERLSAHNYRDETIELYFGYACENRQTSIVFNYDIDVSLEVLEQHLDVFAEATCKLLSKEYSETDALGKEVMKLIYKGGYTFIYRHPLYDVAPMRKKTFEECIL